MYDIPDVPKPEKDGRNAGNYIPAVSYDVKIFESLANRLAQTAVNHARTAEAVAEDIVRDIGAVVYAVLVTQQRERGSVRISHDHDALEFFIENLLFEAISCGFPDPQKSAVHVPPVFHFPIGFRGEVKIIPPVDYSVAVFEKYIQNVAPRLIAERRARFGYRLVLDAEHVVE